MFKSEMWIWLKMKSIEEIIGSKWVMRVELLVKGE